VDRHLSQPSKSFNSSPSAVSFSRDEDVTHDTRSEGRQVSSPIGSLLPLDASSQPMPAIPDQPSPFCVSAHQQSAGRATYFGMVRDIQSFWSSSTHPIHLSDIATGWSRCSVMLYRNCSDEPAHSLLTRSTLYMAIQARPHHLKVTVFPTFVFASGSFIKDVEIETLYTSANTANSFAQRN
jgi:hypothetical protein